MLTENEWSLLKTIEKSVFSVNVKQFADTKLFGELMSVFVEHRQVFGSGLTQQEAKNATIIAAIEYIETKGLEIDVDKTYIASQPKGTKPKKPQWTEKLKGKKI